MTRNVKSTKAALSRTTKPVEPKSYAGDSQPSKRTSDGLENVVAGLGTSRDKAFHTHYAVPRAMNRVELENMYRVSWLAKRIVNGPAEDMTREWRTVVFDSKDDTQQRAVEKLEVQLNIKAKITDALKWSRLYGGCLIIIGTKDKDMSQPLNPETIRQGDLQWLQVVDRWRVSNGGELVSDMNDVNFGYPEYYLIAESSVYVHHSRVLRFDGQKLPYFAWLQNAMWHDSELQHVVDSVKACDTTTRGIATMIFEANVDVIGVPELNELVTQKDGEAKLLKRFQLAATMKSYNRVLLLGDGETYDKKQNQFSNLDKILLMFMTDVCGAADMPMTRLFGQSAGGLNGTGEGELRNYYDMISAKQEAELRCKLEYLDEILIRSALGNMPDDYHFDFCSLWQQSDKEVADTQYVKAQRDQIYLAAGVVTEGVVARELKEDGTYKNMTDEDVKLAEELAESMDEEGQMGMVPGQKVAQTDPNAAKVDAKTDQKASKKDQQ